MKKLYRWILPCIVAGSIMTACSETDELDNVPRWKERNVAFQDSIAKLSEVKDFAAAAKVPAGKMFAIKDGLISTTVNTHLIYCKKLIVNEQGKFPLSTQQVEVNYYGTFINGKKFDGNFKGFGANDIIDYSNITNPSEDNSETVKFNLGSSGGLISGFREAIPYMRTGERWMIYVPAVSAYGEKGNKTIPEASMLCFDIILKSIE